MPSEEIRAFNQQARTALKATFNADYDPVSFRVARAAPAILEAGSTFVAVGQGRLEHRPSNGRPRMLAYVAGGGFCFDASDSHRALVDEIAAAVNADACLIRYRLAPEHPFPAAFDDVAAALERLIETHGPENVTVVGDSAGAGLLLSAVMARLAAGKLAPRRLACLSALTDMAMTGHSHVSNAEADPLFGPQAIIHKALHYLQGHNPTDPAASPYWGDPTGMPPSLFVVGSTEVMRDDSVRFADKARAAGVDARLSVYEDAPHTFPLLARFPESEAAIAEIIAFIREGWS